MHPSIERLAQVMRPPLSGGEVIDWGTWRTDLGFDLPGDFKDFISCYGGGTIDQFLAIYSLAGDGREWREELENAPYMFYEDEYGLADPCPYPVKSGLGGLVPWGASSGPEFGFWYANGPDPDLWPIAVFSRTSVAWVEYVGGFGAYLLDLFSRRIESPFSFNFPQNANPDFMSTGDRNRLRDLGISASLYTIEPEMVVGQIREAGLNPVDFFPSAARFL